MRKGSIFLIVILILIIAGAVISVRFLGLQEKNETNINVNNNLEISQNPNSTENNPVNVENVLSQNNGCPLSEQEVEKLKVKAEGLNSAVSAETKYYGNGINIDFGKYGFTKIDENKISFGAWRLYGDPCVSGIEQKYVLSFIDAQPEADLVNKIKSMEYESKEVSEGLKLKEIIKINNFDVIVWESWGPYPTYSLFFEIPGKNKNYYIESNGFGKDPSDYNNIINVLKTATLE